MQNSRLPNRLKSSIIIAAALIAGGVMPSMASNPIVLETKTAPSGEKYLFVQLKDAAVSFTVEKPKRDDPTLLAAIPAGFVTADEKPVGVLVYGGQVYNKVNPKLGGALEIIGGAFKLIDTKGGAALNSEYLSELAKKNGCLFQQFAIVKNRVPSMFKDQGKYLRRGVGHLTNGKPILVESRAWITLKQFASDMVALGARDLIYTDMGPWKESWIRDPRTGELIDIGNEKAKPVKQLNWLVVTEPKTNSSPNEGRLN